MQVIENQTMDQERALYGSHGVLVRNCAFDGPADGESALKESSDVQVEHVFCNLRYPFWHDHRLEIRDTEMTELCRAALWYSDHISIRDSQLHGIKALRECQDVVLEGCDIRSPEFGWSSRQVEMRRCTAESEYFMLRGENLRFTDVDFKGKYSFQYIQNAVFENCRLDTKDAFWHAKNVVVRDSVIRGEYLAWYSDGLTLERCRILGTQPLCYCRNLRLVDCQLEEADLCFEKSEVEATLTAPVLSIKNPAAGRIQAPSVGEVIRDDPKALGEVVTGAPQGGCAGTVAGGFVPAAGSGR